MTASPAPRNVIFDVGNVLLAWNPEGLLREQLQPDQDVDLYLRSIFSHQTWSDLDEGLLEEEAGNELFAERVGAPVDEIRKLILASKASLKLMPESEALMDDLIHRGSRLYSLTNMSRGTFSFVQGRFGFWKKFLGIVVSAYVRMIKPNPEIYQHLLKTYRLDASDCLFIDDRAQNVVAAQSVGMAAIQFHNADQVRKALQERGVLRSMPSSSA
jgi:HAD superfamily hydrolase (TIGR01509 family)